jgi:crossover junction endodeoxyribonuclease RuvC
MKKQTPQLIIGIDPGTKVTGYGIIRATSHTIEVVDFGCIRPKTTDCPHTRYRTIFSAITELLEKHTPDALSIETQYVHKNVQSAIKLGMARGVATLAATLRNIAVFEYAPMTAKRAVVGNGKASKWQVQCMIKQLLRLSKIPEPEDAADALALAICHAHTTRYNPIK